MKKKKITFREILDLLTSLSALALSIMGFLNTVECKLSVENSNEITQSTKNLNSANQESTNRNSNINSNSVNPVIVIPPTTSSEEKMNNRVRIDKIVLTKDWNVFNNFFSENRDDLTLSDFEYISTQLIADHDNTVKDMYLILLYSRKNQFADKYIAKNLVGSVDPVNHRSLQYISKFSIYDFQNPITNFILKSNDKFGNFIIVTSAFIGLHNKPGFVTEICNWYPLVDELTNEKEFKSRMNFIFTEVHPNYKGYYEETYLYRKYKEE